MLYNLGTALLERHAQRHALGPADMARFGVMIERALVWEPSNPYCWMLWADWFKAQGRRDAQEATLREMVRLFPYDSPARVELARLLIARGRGAEAETVLAEFLERVPDNATARKSLDRLRVGTYFDTTAPALEDERDIEIQEGAIKVIRRYLLPALWKNSSVAVIWQENSAVPESPKAAGALHRRRS